MKQTDSLEQPAALRLGTRSSPLAMAQAQLVSEALQKLGGHCVVIHPVETVGDKILDRPLAEIGGKALWTKELDGALLKGDIDFAVHSMKDVETHLVPGIALAAVLPRADPRDRLVGVNSVAEIPHGANVGTSSPRRAAMLLNRRPDVKTISLRGNVGTRLRQIAEGKVAATFLAAAGLDRLHLEEGVALELADWLPAAAQGIIGITCRAEDVETHQLLSRINHAPSMKALLAERAVLEGLGGSCHTAVAVHAHLLEEGLFIQAELLSPDGQDRVVADVQGAGDPRDLGLRLSEILLSRATPRILSSLDLAARN